MIRKKLVGMFLLCLSLFAYSQNISYFPKGQESYDGGPVQFYKDFHQILIDKGLKPCENKNEFHMLKLVVYEDASVKYVKDELNPELTIKS
jgi:hypothetical protein